jgi:nitrite reductase/ring-hydroxylating ferredoxin subunit
VLKKDSGPFPAEIAEEHSLDRRRFLCTAGAALVAAAGGHWLARRVREAPATIPPLRRESLSDLTAGQARAVERSDGTTLAVRLADGDVVAFDRRCPHLGCPVIWAAARGRFECPCHHAAFDARTGAVLFGPPDRGLTPVTVAA